MLASKKAKTFGQIKGQIIRASPHDYFILKKQKWVPIEHVQALEQKIKNLETDRDNLLKSLHTCTQNLNSYAKESVELKQKLQQFKHSLEIQLDVLKSKPHHSETETQLEIMLDEFKEKFDTLIGGLKKP
jgi:DNA repair exonuclease SbcCD ATPase subunit